MWLNFVLAVLVITLSAILIYHGQLAWGVGLVGVELISLVGLFILGRSTREPILTEQEYKDEHQPSLPFPK